MKPSLTARKHGKLYFRASTAGLIAATLMVCTACFNADRTGSTSDDSPTAEPTPTSTYTPSHSAGGGPQAPETSVPANPEWLPGDEEAAKDVAVNAMRDFARPNVEEKQWANEFARWLTPKATADYSAVDPANVPATEVTGPASLEIDRANGFGATATVPTDVGDYQVQLLRQGQDEPWKVNRLYPPEGAS
ncbi:hypothetical protein SAMN04488693_11931 [Arthrobacter subterraneus]|uniref:Lipoprotein n=1 Tax=Arthrobacter subterraneus TaxID=335973 RepID=A0A1G8MQX9_9MICC|nr:hypothetical protein [Arthrobacter subterraneus]SDI70458.1 hypothetical protein SAMN04488693_11931 [Arthrobacter subterraneus]